MPVAALILLLSAPLLSQASRPASKPAGATLTFTVTWTGKLPVVQPITIPKHYEAMFPKDGAHCRKCIDKGTLMNESLLVGSKGGIRNVAISFPRLKSRSRPPAVTLDNRSCRFHPHVAFVPAGKPLTVTNTDALSHNARIGQRRRPPVANVLVPPKGKSTTPAIRRAGIYEATCDIHPWMKAYLIATRNPWCAVSDEKGRARILDVPAGKDQTLVLWHETLGTVTRKITLAPGEKKSLAFTQKDFKKGY